MKGVILQILTGGHDGQYQQICEWGNDFVGWEKGRWTAKNFAAHLLFRG